MVSPLFVRGLIFNLSHWRKYDIREKFGPFPDLGEGEVVILNSFQLNSMVQFVAPRKSILPRNFPVLQFSYYV